MKKCLIVSYGPVPTPKYQKIEGGGQRCWGLALGLKNNGYEVTIAVNNSFPLDVSTNENIHLINWGEDSTFIEAINNFDIVIMNYAMGGPMSFVVDHLADNVVLILDCYVPIYIEVSARESDDIAIEYSNYSHDILHYNKALQRGDYFLCANVPQKHMYMGALSALGIINPYSYKKERVLLVPFGVESDITIPHEHNPYKELGIKKDDFVLLWFGGLYPWFNIIPLLNTVKRLSRKDSRFKFVIVGGKNPYNQNPDFTKQYETTLQYVKDNDLLDKSVFLVDWVDFSDRINWYQNANTVISINNIGQENIYSWRTRVMDYVWGEIPMLTNGGDPLSDELIDKGAALKLADVDEESLYVSIDTLINNKNLLKDAKTKLLSVKKKYFWENVVEPIDKTLKLEDHPYLDEKLFKEEFRPDTVELVQDGGIKRKLQRVARVPRKVTHLVKSKGVVRSGKLIARTILNRTQKTTISRSRQYYFFSHPIDYTGAPSVLLDVLEDYSEHVSPRNLNLVYPGGEPPLIRRAAKLGVRMDKMVMGVGSRVIQGQLGIKKDDFVLLNTVAVYPNYRDYVLGLLDSGKLNKATWFIHEDKPEIRFSDLGLITRIKRLIKKGVIEIIVPSKQTADEYNNFFETNTVRVVNLRVEVPEKYQGVKVADDFNKLRFIISGTPSDGRKGQLLAISAFSKYLNNYYQKNPRKYRDFELDLIAIGEVGSDYLSTQIRAIGSGLLDNRVHFHPKIEKTKAMELTSNANVTICCSINETFALYVAEGMLMGHVLLRNRSSGYEEQLQEKKNGLTIDEQDISQFAKSIATLLDKNSSSNKELVAMSKKSVDIASSFKTSNYYDQLLQ